MSLTLLIRVHLNKSRCSQKRRFAPQTAALQQGRPQKTMVCPTSRPKAYSTTWAEWSPDPRSKVSGIGLKPVTQGAWTGLVDGFSRRRGGDGQPQVVNLIAPGLVQIGRAHV